MAVFLNGLRNGLSENKYLRRLRGLRRDSRCSMTDDTKIAIEACCQATSGFGPRSVRPIGSVQSSNMDRTDRSVQALFGSVGNRFGPSSISCRSGPTPSQKMSVLRIGPDRTETEPRLSIPGLKYKSMTISTIRLLSIKMT